MNASKAIDLIVAKEHAVQCRRDRLKWAGPESRAQDFNKANPPNCVGCDEQICYQPATPHQPEGREPPTPEEKAKPACWYCPRCFRTWEFTP